MLKDKRTLGILAALVIIAGAAVIFFAGGTTGETPTMTTSDDTALADLDSLISANEYQTVFADGDANYTLVDVRTPQEFNAGHIAGAVNIPVDEIGQRLNEIPGDQPVVVYCRSGNRSARAANTLTDAGFSDVYDIDGGTNAWSSAGLPLE